LKSSNHARVEAFKISKIAGSTNLGFKILPKYINFLVENDLIEVVKIEAVLYKTTKKGIEALWHFEQLRECILLILSFM
jgi:predicted transcriptional regulator